MTAPSNSAATPVSKDAAKPQVHQLFQYNEQDAKFNPVTTTAGWTPRLCGGAPGRQCKWIEWQPPCAKELSDGYKCFACTLVRHILLLRTKLRRFAAG